jgi:cytochrome b561
MCIRDSVLAAAKHQLFDRDNLLARMRF